MLPQAAAVNMFVMLIQALVNDEMVVAESDKLVCVDLFCFCTCISSRLVYPLQSCVHKTVYYTLAAAI